MQTKKLHAAALSRNMRERRLSLRQFRVLLAIADDGSITGAAKKLHVTQTAISKAVAEVANIFGVPMLERRGRQIVLSAAGGQVVATGRRIEAEVRVLLEDVESLTAGAVGLLRVGNQAAESRLLARCVAQFKASRPRVTVSLRDAPNAVLMRDLRSGALDFVFGRAQPEQLGSDFQSVTVPVSRMIVCATVGHPVLAIKALTWREAVKHTWIVPWKGIPVRDHLEKLLEDSGLDFPANYIEYSSGSLLYPIMEELDCLMVLSESYVRRFIAKGSVEVTNLRLPNLVDRFGLIWSKEFSHGPSAQEFRNIFSSAVERHTRHPVAAR